MKSNCLEVGTIGAIILILSACTTPTDKAENTSTMGTTEVAALDEVEQQEVVEDASAHWQADPEAVMTAVFEAAKTKDYTILAGLCDPNGEGDGDTKQICSVAFAPEETKNEFVQWFKYGQVIGKPVVVGDTAMVQFKFGEQGARDETMQMIRRNGSWYLMSF